MSPLPLVIFSAVMVFIFVLPFFRSARLGAACLNESSYLEDAELMFTIQTNLHNAGP